jgi:hypothetical protein
MLPKESVQPLRLRTGYSPRVEKSRAETAADIGETAPGEPLRPERLAA